MDKLSKTIQMVEEGGAMIPHLELTDQQCEHLRKAIRSTFVARSLQTGRYLVETPEECYFVERTLSELGYLRPNRNMDAHEEFVGLLLDLQVEIPERLNPINRHRLAAGGQVISTNYFPWTLAAGAEDLRSEETNPLPATDLMRWHNIHLYLRKKLNM